MANSVNLQTVDFNILILWKESASRQSTRKFSDNKQHDAGEKE